MDVRPARYADVARLQQIEVAAGEPFRALGMDAVADDPPPSAVVLHGFVDRGGAWVLADADDVPVAYLLDARVDDTVHLEQVSVDPAHARRRLGRRLIEHLVDRARTAGGTALTLTTYTDVPWNAPYYRRLGFRDLADDELGPGLQATRAAEIARGLDAWPRTAMRREL